MNARSEESKEFHTGTGLDGAAQKEPVGKLPFLSDIFLAGAFLAVTVMNVFGVLSPDWAHTGGLMVLADVSAAFFVFGLGMLFGGEKIMGMTLAGGIAVYSLILGVYVSLMVPVFFIVLTVRYFMERGPGEYEGVNTETARMLPPVCAVMIAGIPAGIVMSWVETPGVVPALLASLYFGARALFRKYDPWTLLSEGADDDKG